MNKLIAIFVLLITAFAFSEGERILHVSAHPANSEIYVTESYPDFSKKAEYISPAAIPVDYEAPSIRITLFKPGFRDSTIEVSIPRLDESYLMVMLQEETRDHVLEEQEKAMTKRTHRVASNWILLGSLIPYGFAVTSAILNKNANDNAEDIRKKLSNHKIESEKTRQLESDFRDERRSARNYRKATLWGAGVGTAILALGLYLRF